MLGGHLDFIDDDRVGEFLCDYSVTVFEGDQFVLVQDTNDRLTVLVSFVLGVRHAVGHEVSYQRRQLSCILRGVLVDKQRHIHKGVICKRFGPHLLTQNLFYVLKQTGVGVRGLKVRH